MGAWIGALFSGIGAIIAGWMAKKTILATSVVAGFLALTVAFVSAISALTAGIAASLPSWAVGLGYFIPDNAALCFSACVSAKLARWIYDYHVSALRMAASV